MPDFKSLINKAKELAGKHPDQVHSGVQKGEDFADDKLGGKYGDKVDQAGDKVEDYLTDRKEPE
jgi:hypothetical protein